MPQAGWVAVPRAVWSGGPGAGVARYQPGRGSEASERASWPSFACTQTHNTCSNSRSPRPLH